MEMEYKDTSRRGKFIIVLGVVLAVAAGGAAFYLINQAQQLAGSGTAPKVTVVRSPLASPSRTATSSSGRTCPSIQLTLKAS